MSIKVTLRRILLWGLALWVLRAVDDATSFGKTWLFPLLPSAILSLTVDHFRALGATFLASLAAWVIGAGGGYVIALFVGAGRLGAQAPRHRFHLSLSEHFDRFFDWLYVIPLVLTLAMSYAVSMKLFLDYGMPKWLVSMAMVSVTGLALAGYTVYKCVVTAVVFAGDEHLFLAESLFIPGRALRVLRRARVRLVQVRRLRDFDIAVFAEAFVGRPSSSSGACSRWTWRSSRSTPSSRPGSTATCATPPIRVS